MNDTEQSYMPKDKQNEIARLFFETKDEKYAIELFNGNLKFAYFMANKFVAIHKCYHLEIEEVKSICLAALWKGIHLYNPDGGACLTAYSKFHMLDFFYDFLHKSQRIKIPQKTYLKTLNILREIDDFNSKYGKKPSVSYLSKKFDLPEDIILSALNAFGNISSLDMELEDDAVTMYNFTGEEDENHYRFENTEVINLMIKSFDKLNKKEVDIIKSRYGIDCEQETLADIGKRYKLTRERIRQIEEKAVKKLAEIVKTKDKELFV